MNDNYTDRGLNEALTTRWLGRPTLFISAVGSTNELLGALAASGAPAGTAVVTDFQTRGRGRRDRRWQAPRETSILASFLLRPNWPLTQTLWLTMISGLAVTQAIETVTGLATGLKWPNDIVREGAAGLKKLGGILVEGKLAGTALAQAVVGLGLNVNVPAAALPTGDVAPSSLLAETGELVDRCELLVQIAARFEALYEEAEAGRSPQPAWNARLVMINRPVTISGSSELNGVAVGTDAWGRLRVRDEAGREHVVAAGDVTLRQ